MRPIVLWLFFLALMFSSGLSSRAQQAEACPDSLPPRLTIGGYGRVVPGDANRVRDIPSRSGVLVGTLDGGRGFDVLDGPLCADGLTWWQVDDGVLVGWTVEGANGEYWLEPADPPAAQTATPAAPDAVAFEPLRPVVNVLAPGVRARVVVDDPATETINLVVRSEPTTRSDPAGNLAAGDIVTVLGDAVEADGYFWREVETPSGGRGWVVEGFYEAEAERYDRTLIAECPATTDRIAFFIERHIFTANRDGSELCVFDRMLIPAWYTFNSALASFDNRFVWSADGSVFYYTDRFNTSEPDAPLFSLSADGLTRSTVGADVGGVAWADWSPDASRVLMVRGASLWTMRADGSAYGALPSVEGKVEWGAWLADNDRLAFISTVGDEPNQIGPTQQEATIYTISVTQGGLTPIYRTDRELINIDISPDRSKILLASWEIVSFEGTVYGDRGDFQLAVLDVETGEVTTISEPELVLYGGVSWLPDSSGLWALGDGSDGEVLVKYTFADQQISTVPLSGSIVGDFYVTFGGFIDDRWMLIITDGLSYETSDDDLVLTLDILTGEVTMVVDSLIPPG
jgi:hypothetical protein